MEGKESKVKKPRVSRASSSKKTKKGEIDEQATALLPAPVVQMDDVGNNKKEEVQVPQEDNGDKETKTVDPVVDAGSRDSVENGNDSHKNKSDLPNPITIFTTTASSEVPPTFDKLIFQYLDKKRGEKLPLMRLSYFILDHLPEWHQLCKEGRLEVNVTNNNSNNSNNSNNKDNKDNALAVTATSNNVGGIASTTTVSTTSPTTATTSTAPVVKEVTFTQVSCQTVTQFIYLSLREKCAEVFTRMESRITFRHARVIIGSVLRLFIHELMKVAYWKEKEIRYWRTHDITNQEVRDSLMSRLQYKQQQMEAIIKEHGFSDKIFLYLSKKSVQDLLVSMKECHPEYYEARQEAIEILSYAIYVHEHPTDAYRSKPNLGLPPKPIMNSIGVSYSSFHGEAIDTDGGDGISDGNDTVNHHEMFWKSFLICHQQLAVKQASRYNQVLFQNHHNNAMNSNNTSLDGDGIENQGSSSSSMTSSSAFFDNILYHTSLHVTKLLRSPLYNQAAANSIVATAASALTMLAKSATSSFSTEKIGDDLPPEVFDIEDPEDKLNSTSTKKRKSAISRDVGSNENDNTTNTSTSTKKVKVESGLNVLSAGVSQLFEKQQKQLLQTAAAASGNVGVKPSSDNTVTPAIASHNPGSTAVSSTELTAFKRALMASYTRTNDHWVHVINVLLSKEQRLIDLSIEISRLLSNAQQSMSEKLIVHPANLAALSLKEMSRAQQQKTKLMPPIDKQFLFVRFRIGKTLQHFLDGIDRKETSSTSNDKDVAPSVGDDGKFVIQTLQDITFASQTFSSMTITSTTSSPNSVKTLSWSSSYLLSQSIIRRRFYNTRSLCSKYEISILSLVNHLPELAATVSAFKYNCVGKEITGLSLVRCNALPSPNAHSTTGTASNATVAADSGTSGAPSISNTAPSAANQPVYPDTTMDYQVDYFDSKPAATNEENVSASIAKKEESTTTSTTKKTTKKAAAKPKGSKSLPTSSVEEETKEIVPMEVDEVENANESSEKGKNKTSMKAKGRGKGKGKVTIQVPTETDVVMESNKTISSESVTPLPEKIVSEATAVNPSSTTGLATSTSSSSTVTPFASTNPTTSSASSSSISAVTLPALLPLSLLSNTSIVLVEDKTYRKHIKDIRDAWHCLVFGHSSMSYTVIIALQSNTRVIIGENELPETHCSGSFNGTSATTTSASASSSSNGLGVGIGDSEDVVACGEEIVLDRGEVLMIGGNLKYWHHHYPTNPHEESEENYRLVFHLESSDWPLHMTVV